MKRVDWRLRLILAVAFVVFVAAACTPKPQTTAQKWEAWRLREVTYQVSTSCDGDSSRYGTWNPITKIACINTPLINSATKFFIDHGIPAGIANMLWPWTVNHEAAHEMDFALGQIVAKYDCFAYGAGNCPPTIHRRAWERGAECIMQLVRPDLDPARTHLGIASDGYWLCPENFKALYRGPLRFAGVLAG